MLVGLCRWIHPASGHRCVLFLVVGECSCPISPAMVDMTRLYVVVAIMACSSLWVEAEDLQDFTGNSDTSIDPQLFKLIMFSCTVESIN